MSDEPFVQADGAANLPLRWADRAMLPAEPMPDVDPDVGVEPTVTLVSMTPDPLGAVAKVLMLADGRVYRSSADCSDADRRHYWEQSLATHLRAPWEFIDMHFIFEGVPRWWTQQLERQRTATYFEQSLRFAVVEDLGQCVSLPPSLAGTSHASSQAGAAPETQEQSWRNNWDWAIASVQVAYERLIDSGMPAEDARGLLPLATCTRVHYHTNLRALAEHAGNRLCTQAQFLWRIVFAKMIDAIRNYSMSGAGLTPDHWQYHTIADSEIFRPVCYSHGSCPWGADFDRGCKIRGRVDTLGKHGIPSSEWENPPAFGFGELTPVSLSIKPAEWLADPTAARFK